MRLVLAAALVGNVSGAFELKTDPAGDVVRWAAPVRFTVDARLDTRLGAPGAIEAVRSAARTWSASGVEVSVEPGDPGADGIKTSISVISDAWPYDEDVLAVTLLSMDEAHHRIVGARIVLNAAQNRFKVLPADSARGGGFADVQNTVTHELGHALGLAHAADHPEAVMFPLAFNGDVDKRALSDDDRQALELLYPPSTLEVGAQQVGCSAVGSSVFTLAVLLALAKRRRASVNRPTRRSKAGG